MSRLLAKTIILAGLALPLCLYAQPHGAPRPLIATPRSFVPHGGPPRPVPRPISSAHNRSFSEGIPFPPVTGSSLINPGEASCLLNPSFAGSFYCHQYFSGRPAWGFEPVYPAWFPTMGYDTEESAPPPPETEQETPLAAQVGNLASEVELMREDQAARDFRPAPAPPPAAPEEPPSTVLVYRDGRQMEIQNYAIMGKTLWIFSDQKTRQVPLADLDVPATERANSDRGVEFAAPAQP
jgi:hypothetical protein